MYFIFEVISKCLALDNGSNSTIVTYSSVLFRVYQILSNVFILIYPDYVDPVTMLLQLVIKSLTVSNQAVDLIGRFGNGPRSSFIERKSKEATKKVSDIAYLKFDAPGLATTVHDNCSRSYKPKTCESTKDAPIQCIWDNICLLLTKYPDKRVILQYDPKHSPLNFPPLNTCPPELILFGSEHVRLIGSLSHDEIGKVQKVNFLVSAFKNFMEHGWNEHIRSLDSNTGEVATVSGEIDQEENPPLTRQCTICKEKYKARTTLCTLCQQKSVGPIADINKNIETKFAVPAARRKDRNRRLLIFDPKFNKMIEFQDKTNIEQQTHDFDDQNFVKLASGITMRWHSLPSVLVNPGSQEGANHVLNT